MEAGGSTDCSLVLPVYGVILFGHRLFGFSFGRHSGTSLGFAALSLRLTEGSIAYQVSSNQQHSEVEVGHEMSSHRGISSHPLFSARGLGWR